MRDMVGRLLEAAPPFRGKGLGRIASRGGKGEGEKLWKGE